jgi:hypothetical protein
MHKYLRYSLIIVGNQNQYASIYFIESFILISHISSFLYDEDSHFNLHSFLFYEYKFDEAYFIFNGLFYLLNIKICSMAK